MYRKTSWIRDVSFLLLLLLNLMVTFTAFGDEQHSVLPIRSSQPDDAIMTSVSRQETRDVMQPAPLYSAYNATLHITPICFGILLVGIIFLIYDSITRRKSEHALRKSERELRESQRLLASVFDAIQDEVTVIGNDWKTVLSNHVRQGERHTSSAGGTPYCDQCFIASEHPCEPCHIQEVFQSGDTRTLEYANPINGKTQEIRVSPIHDDSGHVIMVVELLRDITARKQAEESLRRMNIELELRVRQRTAELEHVNEELKNFAYIISHDLKAPLRGIAKLIHWLVEDYTENFDDDGKEMVTLLVGRLKRMDALIDGILHYSRIGRLESDTEAVALHALVPEVIHLLTPPKCISITIEDRLPVVYANPIRMSQVFQNLLANAIEFLDKPKGIIRIGSSDDDTHWTFRISDNGPGIDPQHHTRIFKIFQTLQPRDQHESTGIGLTIVKKIVELYGGDIWLESTVGQGTTFFFTLPKSTEKKAVDLST